MNPSRTGPLALGIDGDPKCLFLYTLVLCALHRHKVTHREEMGRLNSDVHGVFLLSLGKTSWEIVLVQLIPTDHFLHLPSCSPALFCALTHLCTPCDLSVPQPVVMAWIRLPIAICRTHIICLC